MLVLNKVYPEGLMIPKSLDRREHHPPADLEDARLHRDDGGDEERVRRLLHLKRHWTHSVIHETLVDLLTIQKEIHPGIFAMMDGTISGDGPGPRAMRLRVTNLILASKDQVAIDATAARLMGFDPMTIRFIRLAHEAGAREGGSAGDRSRGGRRLERESGVLEEREHLRQQGPEAHLPRTFEAPGGVPTEEPLGAVVLCGQPALPRRLLVSDGGEGAQTVDYEY
jgi:hypothetical protein